MAPSPASHSAIRTHHVTLFFLLCLLSLLCSLWASHPSPGKAFYSHGVVYVSLPYRADHPGTGQLLLEILDPEDHVLAKLEKPAKVNEGSSVWNEELRLEKKLPLEDLVWQRIRYHFHYDNERFPDLQATESISELLRMPLLHILGQQSYLSGSKAAVRVIVTDSNNKTIPGRSFLRIDLKTKGQNRVTLFNGQLNRRNTVDAEFQFPANLTCNCDLLYTVDTPLGSTEYTQSIRLQEKVGILLTTEKPIYQPGQMIHARALALDRAGHEAVSNRTLVFEVEDSRGNKVFKKSTMTDKYGIASAEFELASEVNLGTYHLRAVLNDPTNTQQNTAEIALNVQKYVLPKFKVDLEFFSPDQKKKHGYRPGDHVHGTVQANYFFGKPLDAAEVSITATGMDVTTFQAASVHGKTDRDGTYHFDLKLPAYLAGRPAQQGAARLLIEATVKDSAAHSETRGQSIAVSESAFLITAIPEGGVLIPGLENQIFLLAAYPDGLPAQADFKVRTNAGAEQNARTDEGGVAIIPLLGRENLTLQIEAKDRDGETVHTQMALPVRTGDAQILLRTDRAVYHSGDKMQIKVLSTQKQGTVYVDIVKDNQTILTCDLDVNNGAAEVALVANPEMAGTIDVGAYMFGQNAQPVADHRLAFVQPADELKIQATADAAVYKPGDDARIRFRITDARGQGVRAAMGLQIVDEAVFALAEKQPGFAKVFFYLEQEVMKPRFEIHSIGLPEALESVPAAKQDQNDRAARALFAATEVVRQNLFDVETGSTIPQTKQYEYTQRYWRQFEKEASQIAKELQQSFKDDPKQKNMATAFEQLAASGRPEFRDAWGTKLQLQEATWDSSKSQYLLRSAGMDKQFQTGDDFAVNLLFRRNTIQRAPQPGDTTIEANIAHERGSDNGRAQIFGRITDQSGAAVNNAEITAETTSTGHGVTIHSDGQGKFQITVLRPGNYLITIFSPGFRVASGNLSLAARDQAELSVTLMIGEVSESVEITSATVLVENTKAALAGGFGGGIAAVAMARAMGGAQLELNAPLPAAVPAKDHRSKLVVFADHAAPTSVKDETSNLHVRTYFPEALYINPEIITDGNGNASISIPLADNITTWRMSMLASTEKGALGTATSRLKVFQDFFVDLDLPVTLTQGDQVSIPVAIYNYSEGKADVHLQLKQEDWYALVGDAQDKTVKVEANHVGGSEFTLEARRIGKFRLTLSAQTIAKTKRADVIVREIEVVPNGREQTMAFNGQLQTTVTHSLEFPKTAVSDASKLFVRLYPSPLSQIVEGMDSLLRMPGGCFEQTSSSTYPNVLALDYMKRTKKLTPEIHAKAEGFIVNGYQRLLTFELPGGGFSWFGQAPANKILTSYGLMEFYDMSKVHDVDPRLIERTQQWLAAQQLPDGSWKPDTSFINEGATNRYNTDVLRITAYIAWALDDSGYHGPAVEKAGEYIRNHLSAKIDAYTLAVVANFAANSGKDREFTRQAMQMLIDASTEKGEEVWWSADETGVYATGTGASVETTGLAIQALLKWDQASATVQRALRYITAKKDATGAWGSTQATIMALRALLLATEKNSSEVNGNVEILVNGKTARKLTLTAENNELLHQFVFQEIESSATNSVELRFDGKGMLGYQVAGQYFLPWEEKPVGEALTINIAYDRTKLAQDDMAGVTATIRNNLDKTAKMVMVDLGIPPGFDLLSEDLQDYQEKSANQKTARLEKFNLTATQAILYFDTLAPGETVELHFRLRAKYPVRARTLRSRVYEYYDPDVTSEARPVYLEVRPKP